MMLDEMSLDEHSIFPTVKASKVILCTHILPKLKVISTTIYALKALKQMPENQILPCPQVNMSTVIFLNIDKMTLDEMSFDEMPGSQNERFHYLIILRGNVIFQENVSIVIGALKVNLTYSFILKVKNTSNF
jgi:hypothetical protein